jgi:hypothetical protein
VGNEQRAGVELHKPRERSSLSLALARESGSDCNDREPSREHGAGNRVAISQTLTVCGARASSPGLWLDGKALLAGELPQVLVRLQEGIQSPEHQRFVAHLVARSSGGFSA